LKILNPNISNTLNKFNLIKYKIISFEIIHCYHIYLTYNLHLSQIILLERGNLFEKPENTFEYFFTIESIQPQIKLQTKPEL
jgi:hypothetical protein